MPSFAGPDWTAELKLRRTNMRALTASTFAAIAAALVLGANPAWANTTDDQSNFDLGVDVTSVPLDRPDVAAFLATLSPEGQSIMQTTCQHYLSDPGDAESPSTVPFCHVVASGTGLSGVVTGSVRTFGAVNPPVIAAPSVVQGGGAAAGHRYSVFPDESSPNFNTDTGQF
jgi:hypothetical protein